MTIIPISYTLAPMVEPLRQLSLEDAAEALKIVDGVFARDLICDGQGDKSAHGKLLMIMGAHDKDLVEMTRLDADELIRRNLVGITDIQIALLYHINDRTANRDPSFLTGRIVDALIRPEHLLGSNTELILTADKVVHTYTREQLQQIDAVDWNSWEVRTAVSTAMYCATKASGIEGGWYIGRCCARESVRCFGHNFGEIYTNTVNEIQGYGFYDTLKPSHDNPNQPEHRPFFIQMLTNLEGNPLSIKTLRDYVHNIAF